MLNIKKAEVARNEAITVSEILFNNFVSLSFIIMFCWFGNVYAQMNFRKGGKGLWLLAFQIG